MLTISLSASGLKLQCDRSSYVHTDTHTFTQTQRAQLWEEVSMPTAVSLAKPSDRLAEIEIITKSITSSFLECLCVDCCYSAVCALLINLSGSSLCVLRDDYRCITCLFWGFVSMLKLLHPVGESLLHRFFWVGVSGSDRCTGLNVSASRFDEDCS